MKHKICIVTPDIIGPVTNGGVGTACFWQARAYSNAGHDVTILFSGQTHLESGLFWERHYGQKYGIHYVDLNRYIEQNHPAIWTKTLWPHIDALKSSYFVLEFFKHNDDYDIIFFQDYLGHGLRPLQFKKAGLGLQGTVCVLTLHSSQQWIREGMQCVPHSKDEAILDFAEQESARLSDHTVAPSDHMAEWAYDRMHLVRRPHKIPYCFESHAVGTCNKTFTNFRHLIFFGRLETRKGLHLFLEALPSILETSFISRVSFLGKAATINGTPSIPLIQKLFGNYPRVELKILDDLSSKQAWEYMKSQEDILVVTPSIFDNLPLAVIELYSRRIPFISTRVGGIPEIVGRNKHLLSEASGQCLQQKLLEILSAQELRINYDSGFSSERAVDQHLDFISQTQIKPPPTAIADPHPPLVSIIIPHYNCPQLLRVALHSIRQQRGAPPFEVIVCDDGSEMAELEQYRELQNEFTTFTFLECAENGGPGAARNHAANHAKGGCLLFFDADNEAMETMVVTLSQSLLRSDYDCLTCFNNAVHTDTGHFLPPLKLQPSRQLHNPLGAALEAGVFLNVFGDTCSIVKKNAFDAIGGFPENCSVEDWVFFTTLVANGHSLGVVPVPLYYYRIRQGSRFHAASTYEKCQDILDCYTQAEVIERVDWRYVLSFHFGYEHKTLRHQSGGAPTDQSSYHLFSGMEESALLDYLRARTGAGILATLDEDLSRIHDRLIEQVPLCENNQRVLIYGAGLHTKALLGSFPALYRKVHAFIDRSGSHCFLGKQVYLPDDYSPEPGDIVIYSSKSAEQSMYERMKHHDVKHILLYSATPEPRCPTR